MTDYNLIRGHEKVSFYVYFDNDIVGIESYTLRGTIWYTTATGCQYIANGEYSITKARDIYRLLKTVGYQV
jgi:hypothetical protein